MDAEPEPGSLARSAIPRTVYINLARRQDRREAMEALMKTLGIDAVRHEATSHQCGVYGCAVSHIDVLRAARADGVSAVLVLEDDFELHVEPSVFWHTLDAFFAAHGSDYEVCLLGFPDSTTSDAQHTFLPVTGGVRGANAYIIHASMLDALIAVWEAAAPVLLATYQHWVYAPDVVWWQLQSRPGSKWFRVAPALGGQNPRAGSDTPFFTAEQYAELEGVPTGASGDI